MATTWTIEKELCGLSDAPTAGEALCRLGIIPQHSPAPVLQQVHGWTRGGGETFIYRFQVVGQQGVVRDIMLKAVVAFSTVRTLGQLGGEWVERRRLLEQEGVLTPHLYFAGKALIVEDHIPHQLAAYLRRGHADTKRLCDQVICYAAALDKHGFCPISAFHALRTDGTNVYAVDFGQDLGPAGLKRGRSSLLLREALSWFTRVSGKRVDECRARRLFASYAADRSNEGII
jgi:hypothetical protein